MTQGEKPLHLSWLNPLCPVTKTCGGNAELFQELSGNVFREKESRQEPSASNHGENPSRWNAGDDLGRTSVRRWINNEPSSLAESESSPSGLTGSFCKGEERPANVKKE